MLGTLSLFLVFSELGKLPLPREISPNQASWQFPWWGERVRETPADHWGGEGGSKSPLASFLTVMLHPRLCLGPRPSPLCVKVKMLPATARRQGLLLQRGGIGIWEPPTNSYTGINSPVSILGFSTLAHTPFPKAPHAAKYWARHKAPRVCVWPHLHPYCRLAVRISAVLGQWPPHLSAFQPPKCCCRHFSQAIIHVILQHQQLFFLSLYWDLWENAG